MSLNRIKILKYKSLLLIAGLMMLPMFTWAIPSSYHKLIRKQVVVKQASTVNPVHNKELLDKFDKLFKKYDAVKSNYTIAGVINIQDRADSSANLTNLSFLFCKNGNNMYYRLGNTESLNAGGQYISIDHQAKTIVLSAQKQLSESSIGLPISDMRSALKSEQYQLSGEQKANIQTITLLNEHHISCKEYTLSYDIRNWRITHIHARLSNFEYPLRKDKEKILDVAISRWDTEANISQYLLAGQVIKRRGAGWGLTGKFTRYQLIRMQ